MRPLIAQEMLDAWERGLAGSPVERALALVCAACPETAPEDLARESVGRRDARLLALREWAFGPQFVSVASCPRCGERLETSFTVGDIQVQDPEAAPAGPLSVSVEGCELTFRLPDSRDLAALAEPSPLAPLPISSQHSSPGEGNADELSCLSPSSPGEGGREGSGEEGRGGEGSGGGHSQSREGVESARRLLFERCLLGCRGPEGEEISLDSLPGEALQAVTDRMAAADPQADVELALRCPACGHAWLAPFDIASFFWTEVDAWARRLLYEIHALARAYGWREGDVLALSPWRRSAYLELIGG